MYHFFVTPASVRGGQIYIEGSDVNHIRNVLRMKEGEELCINDGNGTEYLCEITEISPDKIVCDIKNAGFAGTEPPARYYLFQGLPKADKFEYIIQKSVELGAFEVIPVKTARSIVKYDEKKEKAKLERWNKISESAAKQSRRGIIPQVKEIMTFKEALAFAQGLDINLIPYENFKSMEQTRSVYEKIKPGMSVGIFIGPEGGFEQAEVAAACASGAYQISLGSRILRTETAPLALLSVLNYILE